MESEIKINEDGEMETEMTQEELMRFTWDTFARINKLIVDLEDVLEDNSGPGAGDIDGE